MTYLINQFSNVVVMPLSSLDHRAGGTCGGPIWPDWDVRVRERHCRNGKPADQCPAEAAVTMICDFKEAYWGGLVDQHFGHQIADFLMRVIPSRFVDPTAKFIFGAGPKPEPGWFWELLEWFDVGRSDVLVVRQPMLARQLRVVPQAEQLWGVEAPTGEHLDVMDRFIAAKTRVSLRSNSVVYVSRAGLHPLRAKFAGEGYIEHCIREAGGTVVRPEATSIEDQMRLYRSARTLIFSGGSALHLLQLAGRSFQDVYVLERRPGSALLETLLRPRCKLFRQLNITRSLIATLNVLGDREDHAGLSLPSSRLLVREFSEAGCDVGPHFREDAFEREVLRDTFKWVSVKLPVGNRMNWQESNMNVATDLRSAGYSGLADRVLQWTQEASRRLSLVAD